jgi:hypothetical protein
MFSMRNRVEKMPSDEKKHGQTGESESVEEWNRWKSEMASKPWQ